MLEIVYLFVLVPVIAIIAACIADGSAQREARRLRELDAEERAGRT